MVGMSTVGGATVADDAHWRECGVTGTECRCVVSAAATQGFIGSTGAVVPHIESKHAPVGSDLPIAASRSIRGDPDHRSIERDASHRSCLLYTSDAADEEE